MDQGKATGSPAAEIVTPARQWPGDICSGEIRYAPAHNYDGFFLADAMHGIPTFGSVSPTDPVTIRGQSVHVFNYPKQTEEIAAQIVLRWNAFPALVKALEQFVAVCDTAPPTSLMIEIGMALKVARAALCSAASARMEEPPSKVTVVPNSQAKSEVVG